MPVSSVELTSLACHVKNECQKMLATSLIQIKDRLAMTFAVIHRSAQTLALLFA